MNIYDDYRPKQTLEYEVIVRVHLMGLFLGALGVIGMMVKLRKTKLIL